MAWWMRLRPRSRALERLFTTKRNAGRYKERAVSVGNHRPTDGHGEKETAVDDEQQQHDFIDNEIRTSKYSAFTFLPRNLFQQFRRIANFYFLSVGGVQLLIDSPVSPFTSIAPLIFVVVVTMVKQGYEDFMRHKADREVNDRLVSRVDKNGQLTTVKSRQIQVGNIIRINDGESFPCDLLLLSTSVPNGKASLMTANLDGETNLKVHSAPQLTRHLQEPVELAELMAVVECENPNANLTRFIGRLKVFSGQERDDTTRSHGLTLENVALRGTELRNTDFVYGCAVYTGHDTKMSRNSKMTSNKFSTVEKSMNRYLVFYLILLLLEVLLASVLKYQVGLDRPDCPNSVWYLGGDVVCERQLAQDVLSFLVLFNYIIPISLYVTLELQKFFGSFFFVWDLQLYDYETDQPAKCNSSDLNEELGQVEHLFSDKTGTLTENVMEFKECSIAGIQMHDHNGQLVPNGSQEPKKNNVERFLEVLALCHTVQAGTTLDGDITYSAASPDEKALVVACKSYGVTYLGEKETDGGETVVKLRVSRSRSDKRNAKIKFQRLHVLEFDSERKRMSVLVRDTRGYLVVTKGAESSVLPRCRRSPIVDVTATHINDYAMVGLRTLAVAVKRMNNAEAEDFLKSYAHASQALTQRGRRVQEVYDLLERDLELIGAVAVEDKLQEDVTATLIRLGAAGIRVWILTGDKKETAVNISYSCGHFQPDMRLFDLANGLDPNSVGAALEAALTACKASPEEERRALVIDGAALTVIFAFGDQHLEPFAHLADRCSAVICCRMSPLQKADVVRLIKRSKRAPVTAAIGDGANDVSMIQEAHVGLGITGKEGRAAVRAADFAFAKFKHLQRVLLVHGHWYYYRVSILVQYFFYKNVAGFTAQLFFAFFNSYSTQTLYDSMSLTLFNIVFTSLPVFVFGLLEQNVPADRLLGDPMLYSKITRNSLLSVREFGIWFTEGLWHSAASFFLAYAFWAVNFNITSVDFLELTSFGLTIYSCCVVVTNLKLLLFSRHWNVIFVVSIILSIVAFFLFTMVWQSIRLPPALASFFLDFDVDSSEDNIPASLETYWVCFHVFSSLGFWSLTTMIVAISLVPDLVVPAVRKASKGFGRRFHRFRKSFSRPRPKPSGITLEELDNNVPYVPKWQQENVAFEGSEENLGTV